MTVATITYETDFSVDPHNTSLKCKNVKASYRQLVDLFGEPEQINADHSRVEWRVRFSDDEILCIYDWNDSRPVEEVTEWNVSGHNFMAAARIYDILAGRPIIAA